MSGGEATLAIAVADAPRRFQRSINVVQLVAAFAVGQGSLFLAQTWLVHTGQLALLGRFGALSAFAMLGMLIVDLNALTTLARKVAATAGSADRRDAVWRAYAPVTAVRLGAALAVVALAAVYALFERDGFALGYVAAVVPGFIVWSFNGAGLLDGLQRSGISGIALALPYLASALTLPVASHLAPMPAGLALGAVLSAGFAAAVVLHLVALARLGFAFRAVRPERGAVKVAAREGLAMTVQWLPGQAFYRFEILLCGWFLGGQMVGLFVYAKQITNAASQIAGFLRRVEFPALVRQLAETPARRIGTTFLRLRGGIAGAAVTGAGVAAFALVVGPLLGPRLAHAAGIVAIFAPVVFSGALSATLTLGLFALGRYGEAARIANLSLVGGVVLALALVPALGLAGFVSAEVLMQMATAGLALTAIKRQHQ
jgi:O-antigen/teichoic acid export membrane protein